MTMFEQFWEECQAILMPTSAANYRRHSIDAYVSEAHVLDNSIKHARERLLVKVEKGENDGLPHIPCRETV